MDKIKDEKTGERRKKGERGWEIMGGRKEKGEGRESMETANGS